MNKFSKIKLHKEFKENTTKIYGGQRLNEISIVNIQYNSLNIKINMYVF